MLAAVSALVLIVVLVLVVVLVLILVLVLIVVLILILVLVIHIHFLRTLYLQQCRNAILPQNSAFILIFEDKTDDQTADDGGSNAAGGSF